MRAATRRIVGATAVVALLLPIGGCRVGSFGPKVDDFAPARSGRGVTTRILQFEAGRVGGELLEVREAGILVLTAEPAIVFFPWATIRHATFDDVRATLSHGDVPGGATREELRLVSRYSQGLDQAQLRALLDAYGLDAVREAGS